MRASLLAALLAVTLPSHAGEEIPKERQGTWALTPAACKSGEAVVVKESSVEIGIGGKQKVLTDFITSHSCYGKGDPEGYIFCVMPNEGSGFEKYSIEINSQKKNLTFTAFDKTTDDLASIANKPLKKCK